MSHSFPPVPQAVATKVAARQVVAFVGAGFSMSVGMPTWPGLIRKLIEAADEANSANVQAQELLETARFHWKKGEFAESAAAITDVFTAEELEKLLRSTFSPDVYRLNRSPARKVMDERMKNIVRTPWAGLITTNFDTLLEDAYKLFPTSAPGPMICHGKDPFLGSLLAMDRRDGAFLVKLHGDNWQSERILTSGEYAKRYLSHGPLRDFLKAVMLGYPLLFLGSSLEPEILRVRRELSEVFERRLPTSYILLPKNLENVARAPALLRDNVIETIFYDVDVDQSHSGFDAFLAELARIADPVADECLPPPPGLAWPNLPEIERKAHLGRINTQLLEWIREQPDRRIRQDMLLLPARHRLKFGLRRADLLYIPNNELLYRLYFLMVLGYLERCSMTDGGDAAVVHYCIPADHI